MTLLSGVSAEFLPTGAVTAIFGSPLLLFLLPRLRASVRPPFEASVPQAAARFSPALRLALCVSLALSLVAVLFLGRDATGAWQILPPDAWAEILPWRAPRLIAAAAAGAMVAVAGFILQRLTGNEMASPEVLGVSAGAAFAFALSLFIFDDLGLLGESLVTSLGGLAVLVAIIFYARRTGFSPETILLAGIALNALLDAFVGVLAAGGDPLRLTIDSNVQWALEAELSSSAAEYDAEGGAGVVLNARNGEVLGLASWPPIDPNRAHGVSKTDPSRTNRAISAVYELGSVFKPITIAAGIDTGAIHPSDKFDVREPVVISGRRISDSHRIAGPLTPLEIVSESSNIGTVKVAIMLGARRQQEVLEKLGLFERSPIEVAGSAAPIVPQKFDDIHAATVSYGHGIAVSPMAFASAFSVFANGGEVIEPTIIADGARERTAHRVISAPTAALVTHMLRDAVIHGTGKKAEVAGYRVAGKTGTAEKAVAGGYARNVNMASFAAIFPADSPEYVVLIVLDSPKADVGRGRTASWNAAPTAGRVIDRIAPMLGVEPRFDEFDRQGNPAVRSVAERRSTL